MSARLHRAPLAVASDGSVLVNLAHFDGVASVADAVEKAVNAQREVFFGVVVTTEELHRIVLPRVAQAAREAAAYVAGGRNKTRAR